MAERDPGIETPGSRMLSLGRAVVVLVVGAVVTAVALVAAVAEFATGSHEQPRPVSVSIAGRDVLVQYSCPADEPDPGRGPRDGGRRGGAITFEAAAVVRTFRNPERRALQTVLPRWTLPSRRGQDPTRITILVPAHDEELSLPGTLEALREQSRQPERVVVVADNCTDGTVAVARAFGYEVFETEGNVDRKAGALNQALAKILPTLGADDAVMVMDADTRIGPLFLETAAARLDADPAWRRWAACSSVRRGTASSGCSSATSTAATPRRSRDGAGGSSSSPARRRSSVRRTDSGRRCRGLHPR